MAAPSTEDWIAINDLFTRYATALDHGLTVVSRDVGDYRKARVPTLNPWLGEVSGS